MKLARLISDISSPLLFHLGPSQSLDDFERHLGRLDQDIARKSDAYFFSIDRQLFTFLLQAGRASFLSTLVRRSREKPCGFVTFDSTKVSFRCGLARPNGQLIEVPEADALVRCLRRTDLVSLIHEKKELCLLVAPPGTHFVTPSGTHCERFIRVANVLNDPQSLFRIAFWLQQSLSRVSGVLIDTWGIVPLVLEVMRLLGRTFHYDCLPAHAMTSREESIDRLCRLFKLAGSGNQVMFLQSIKGSGNLLNEMRNEVIDQQLEKANFCSLSIYGLPPFDEENPVLADLPPERSFYLNENSCKLCQDGLEVVRIDPKLYYVVAPSEQEVPLTPQFWDAAKRFFERYKKVSGVLRVHADHPHDSRHHAFYIDTSPLLSNATFKKRFLDKIHEITPSPDIVISPNHECGKQMANLVVEKLKIPKIQCEHLRRNELSNSDVGKLKRAQSILIVDDVFINGTRVRNYLCGLREDYNEDSVPWKRISFIGGIARPSSHSAWKEIRAACSNHQNWQVSCECVEFLLLPNWPQHLCPWCREYDFLSRCSQTMAVPPEWLLKRLLLLTDKAQGIPEHSMLSLLATEPTLGAGAIIGLEGLNGTATLFAAASALQHLRSAEDKKGALVPGFPMSNVFAMRNFTNYSEALLRASLLRCLRPDEFPSRSQKNVREHLVSCGAQPNQEFMLGELMLAMSRKGILPPDYSKWKCLMSRFGEPFAERASEVLDIRK